MSLPREPIGLFIVPLSLGTKSLQEFLCIFPWGI